MNKTLKIIGNTFTVSTVIGLSALAAVTAGTLLWVALS